MKKVIFYFTVFYFFILNCFSQSILLTPNQIKTRQNFSGDNIFLQGTNPPNIIGIRHGGTLASPTGTISGNTLLSLGGGGITTGNILTTERASIKLSAADDFTNTSNPTRINFYTTPFGSINSAERMVISDLGKVGIGTSFPNSILHVSDGNSGVTPHPDAKAFFESAGNSYINIAGNDGLSTGLLFGKTTNAAHGGIIYTAFNHMLLRTGGNQTRMTILSNGDIGIGTSSPDTKLHIDGNENDGTTAALKITSGTQNMILDGNEIDVAANGSIFINNNSNGGVYLAGGGGGVRVGANGTGLTEIIRSTENIASFTVLANSCAVVSSFPVTNAAFNSTVFVSPDLPMTNNLYIGYARVVSAGNVQIRFCNASNSIVNQPTMDYHITVIR
jgi:trimeric autotransporter adhesin